MQNSVKFQNKMIWSSGVAGAKPWHAVPVPAREPMRAGDRNGHVLAHMAPPPARRRQCQRWFGLGVLGSAVADC